MGFKVTTLAFSILFLFATASEFCAGIDRLNLGPVIGIDFGTTYSRVGVYTKGEVVIIPNNQGNRSTPSWVAFTDTGRLIGVAAKNQAAINPERTIFHVQRLLGRKYDDPEVQEYTKMLPYKIVNKDGKPHIEVKIREETQVFSPEEISAMILQNMKEIAEAYIGKKIQYAVMATAYFNDAQTQATKEAYAIAGLNVVRTINRPTARAMSYGLHFLTKNILVFDLGGGTFDVSILSNKFGDEKIEVLSTSGDIHLGGEDFNNCLMDYFVKLIMKKHNKDISQDKRALGKLRNECERAKHVLSSQHQVQVGIEQLFDDVDFSEVLTRARFEELNVDIFNKTMGHVKQALKEAGLEKSEVNEIVLVGGSTRIPKVQEMLRDYFDGKELINTGKLDEAVAYGAAIEGWNARREGIRELQDDFGASPRWSISIGLSLGIETAGGIMTKVLHRNTPTPEKRSHVFSTYQDNQTTVSIKVYQGERALTRDCVELGSFELSGIQPAPRGVPQIEVTFTVDWKHDRIHELELHVMAQDKATNESNSVTISYNWDLDLDPLGLGPERKEKILEAFELEEEDRKLKEKIKSNIEDMVEEHDMSTAVTCVDEFGKGCVPDYYMEMIEQMIIEHEELKEAVRLYQDTKTVEEEANGVILFPISKSSLNVSAYS